MAENLEGKQQLGSFSIKDLLEFASQYNSADELQAGAINGVLEFRHHIMNMADNVRDLFREYLFPNLINSVQVVISMRAAHDNWFKAVIGDDDSDAVISRAFDNLHKGMKETEKEAE